MRGVGAKLLGAIKSMYVDSLPCVRIKGGESEQFMRGGVNRARSQ